MNTVDKVINIAKEQVGYLEKSIAAYQKDPSVIYRKIDGAGNDNITVYNKEMHDIYPTIMDFPAAWCDCFVDWCFYKAYGVTTAKKLLHGNFDDYTVASCDMYRRYNALHTTPKIGDQVFFTKTGTYKGCYHTGLVYYVDNNYFYTIEGNTSNADKVVANGGGVAKKKYLISKYKNKVLFGRPRYEYETSKTIREVALEVIDGKWGVGRDRKERLTNEGYDYKAVQKEVNSILKGERQ